METVMSINERRPGYEHSHRCEDAKRGLVSVKPAISNSGRVWYNGIDVRCQALLKCLAP